MVDNVDRLTRSRMMASVRGKDTKPEVLLRKALHARGFRYRTHVTNLTGKPDIVLKRYQAVILVHGCFWHGHDCRLFRLPATRRKFWKEKIRRNRERDSKVLQALSEDGWRCLTVWECAIRGPEKRNFSELIDEVACWLTAGGKTNEICGKKPVSSFPSTT